MEKSSALYSTNVLSLPRSSTSRRLKNILYKLSLPCTSGISVFGIEGRTHVGSVVEEVLVTDTFTSCRVNDIVLFRHTCLHLGKVG